jgi:hypothetical protein
MNGISVSGEKVSWWAATLFVAAARYISNSTLSSLAYTTMNPWKRIESTTYIT